MKAVAAMNTRVKDAVYHVVLSWPGDENPTDDQAFLCGRRALGAVGMEAHQYIFALHRDTAHVHLHIAVNRVHPDSFKAVYPDRDFFKLDRVMRELELENGWRHDRGPYAVFERGGVKVIDWASKDPATAGKRPSRASDMERHGDTESLFSYVRGAPRTAVMALLETATADWDGLHAVLARYSLELRLKGRGLAVYDTGGQAAVPVKASDVHESLSKVHLEARLGAFQPRRADDAAEPTAAAGYDKLLPPKRDPQRREQQRQERADARRALYDRYGIYTASFTAVRQDGTDAKRRFREVAEDARRKRDAARSATRSAAERKALYSIIAFETLRSRERIKTELVGERNAIKGDPANRRLRFREWLASEAEKGDQGAISQLRGWAYAEKREARALNGLGLQPGANGVMNGYRGVEPQDPIARNLGDGISFHVERNGTVVYVDTTGLELLRDHGQFVEIGAAAGARGAELAARYAREKFERPGREVAEDGVRIDPAAAHEVRQGAEPTGSTTQAEPSSSSSVPDASAKKRTRRPRM